MPSVVQTFLHRDAARVARAAGDVAAAEREQRLSGEISAIEMRITRDRPTPAARADYDQDKAAAFEQIGLGELAAGLRQRADEARRAGNNDVSAAPPPRPPAGTGSSLAQTAASAAEAYLAAKGLPPQGGAGRSTGTGQACNRPTASNIAGNRTWCQCIGGNFVSTGNAWSCKSANGTILSACSTQGTNGWQCLSQ